MALILVPVFRCLKRDYHAGLALCVGLMVSMPDYLRLSFGGGIPELTIHRLLLIVLLLFWVSVSRQVPSRPAAPFLRGLFILGATQLMSLLLSVYFSGSVKSFLAFALEIVLFFMIVSTSLREREVILKVLSAVAVALGVVAVIAGIERRWEINLSQYLVLGNGDVNSEDITSTYPHRIVLGYAMAMVVPVILAVKDQEPRKKKRLVLWCLLLLAIAGCYFSNSRGPWSGLIIGTAPLIIFGSRDTKRVFVMFALLAVLVLAVRPGVRETLTAAIGSLTDKDEDSVKGNSYQYRWRLWHVAFAEIKKSPERMLFGYGGLSTETMDLSDYFERGTGGNTALTGFTSWDNQLACDLIELGFVGLAVEAGLYLGVLGTLVVIWFRSPAMDKSILLAIISACTIYLYAQSNVYLFSPQLKCLFWGLAACGLRLGQLKQAPVTAPEMELSSLESPLSGRSTLAMLRMT